MRVISFSDARNKLKSVLDQVVEDCDYTIISRRNAEYAVVMSLDHFNGLMETVHLLGAQPMRHIWPSQSPNIVQEKSKITG